MERIESHLSTSSDEFKRNKDAMEALVKRLRAEIDRIREGGPEHARKRHVERGKLLARERVKKLLDPASPFLGLSAHTGCTTATRRARASLLGSGESTGARRWSSPTTRLSRAAPTFR